MISRARALRLAAWASVCASLTLGTWIDEAPDRPREERAGFVVLRADLHSHTRFSDGVLGPCDLLVLGRRRGLDVLAVTEHNTVFPGQLARACAPFVRGAPVVVVGSELTTRDAHVLALGIEESVDARLPLADALGDVHRQGGVAIAAHPTARFWPALTPVCDQLDGVEVVHPIASRGASVIGSWAEMVDFAEGSCPGKAAIGTSDYHGGHTLGRLQTLVFATEPSAAGVLEAIRARRTVTYAPDGRAFGDPDLLKELATRPLVDRGVRYDHSARGWLDAASRLLGLAALVTLLLVSARRDTSG